MKMKKIVALLLAVVLMLHICPIGVHASENLSFRVETSTQEAGAGELVELTVSLTGYTDQADAIRGLQVDVTGADPKVLEVVSCSSMISDAAAASNTASKREEGARLLYVQLDGALAAPSQDVFKVVFRVHPDVTNDGSITLPVTVKIQTESRQITLTDACTIAYTAAVFSVDLSWGNMEFTYNPGSQGEWDPETHSYKEGTAIPSGWTCDENADRITVTNHSNVAVTATAMFEPSAEFADGLLAKEGVWAGVTGNSTGVGGNTMYLDKAGNDQQPVSGSFTVGVTGDVSEAFEDLILGTITVTIQ